MCVYNWGVGRLVRGGVGGIGGGGWGVGHFLNIAALLWLRRL